MVLRSRVVVSVGLLLGFGCSSDGADERRMTREAQLQADHHQTFGLPLVDLAGETGRQVVVDREPGQYLGHPTTQLLPNGTLLTVYPKGHGQGPVVYKRSGDGGLTWSHRLPVPDSWETSKKSPPSFRSSYGTERLD